MIKAIKIDVEKQTCYEVNLDNSTLQSYYNEIGCEMIEAVYIDSIVDTLFIDEEGLLKPGPKKFYSIFGYEGVLCGNGIIVGVDSEGESVDTHYTDWEIQDMIKWCTEEENHIISNRVDLAFQ